MRRIVPVFASMARSAIAGWQTANSTRTMTRKAERHPKAGISWVIASPSLSLVEVVRPVSAAHHLVPVSGSFASDQCSRRPPPVQVAQIRPS